MLGDNAHVEIDETETQLQVHDFSQDRKAALWPTYPWINDVDDDPIHPSKRKPKKQDATEIVWQCGPLGGAMSLYWYYVQCPAPGSKRPRTPVFNN